MAEMGRGSQAQEECLYCHGNTNFVGPCPMCGDTRLAESAVRNLYRHSPLKPDYRLKIPFEPTIAGI